MRLSKTLGSCRLQAAPGLPRERRERLSRCIFIPRSLQAVQGLGSPPPRVVLTTALRGRPEVHLPASEHCSSSSFSGGGDLKEILPCSPSPIQVQARLMVLGKGMAWGHHVLANGELSSVAAVRFLSRSPPPSSDTGCVEPESPLHPKE